MVNSGCKKSEEEMDSFPKRGKKEANKPYFKTPKEEFTNSISADLDEFVININDEDTTKTLDETSVMKNQKREDIQNRFDGTYEDQLEMLNNRVKKLSTELNYERIRYEKLEKTYMSIKSDRDKLKKLFLKNLFLILNVKARIKPFHDLNENNLQS